jgi:hypothetical protein
LANQAFRIRKGLVGGCVTLLAAIIGMAGLTACGAPQYTYVADSAAKAYFKVPYSWHAISQSALAQSLQTTGTGVWVSAFGATSAESSQDVFSFDVDQPFVFAEVETLNSATSAALSYNGLTDIFLPVTSQARSAESGELPVTNFQLLRQSTLTPGSHGVHGVRVTYDYTYQDGTADTFDQVALTNADQTQVYLLMVHCTTSCYNHNQKAIDDIMSSFTVGSPL